MHRVPLPTEATVITPGYSWAIDLDVLFDGQRPVDWTSWTIRMHVWSEQSRVTVTNGAGVSFGVVNGIMMPTVRLTGEQTNLFRNSNLIQYVVDFTSPTGVGDAEDYFAGVITKAIAPPQEMLQ